MSKAFTKEEDGDDRAIIPPRAPLPPGVPNYVTVRGMAQLREEWARLERERSEVEASEEGADRARRLALLHGRIGALAARIGSARVVEIPAEKPTEVRFGTTVTVQATNTGETKRFKIVGVDEADAAAGLIAFVSPIARALLGRAAGELVTVRAGRGAEEEWVIQAITQPGGHES